MIKNSAKKNDGPTLHRIFQGLLAAFIIGLLLAIAVATFLGHTVFQPKPAVPEWNGERVRDLSGVLPSGSIQRVDKMAVEFERQNACRTAVLFTGRNGVSADKFAEMAADRYAEVLGPKTAVFVFDLDAAETGFALRGDWWGGSWDTGEIAQKCGAGLREARYSSAAAAFLKGFQSIVRSAPDDVRGEAEKPERAEPGNAGWPWSAGLFLVVVDLAMFLWLFKNLRKQNRENPYNLFTMRRTTIPAALAGILCGVGLVYSVLSSDPQPEAGQDPAEWVPRQAARVTDSAKVLSPEGVQKISEAIAKVEQATGGQIAVIFISSLNGTDIREFGIAVAQKWALGMRGKDNGALLTFAIEDRKNGLEIGYGWEGCVNDARAGDLLRSAKPELRAGKYADAAEKIVLGIGSHVLRDMGKPDLFSTPSATGEKPEAAHLRRAVYPYQRPPVEPESASGIFCGIMFLVWLLLLILMIPYIKVRGGGSFGGGGGGRGGGGGSFGGGGASGSW